MTVQLKMLSQLLYTKCYFYRAVYTEMKWLLGVVIGTLICISVADNENARLLASKNILNLYMVENKVLTVEYQIYNVGGRY